MNTRQLRKAVKNAQNLRPALYEIEVVRKIRRSLNVIFKAEEIYKMDKNLILRSLP